MFTLLVFNIFFFLPSGLANLTPILASRIPPLKKYTYPLDFKLKFRNRRIFGTHKTIRGLVCGILIGILTVYIEQLLYSHFRIFQSVVSINYMSINPPVLGFLMGFGALGGDSAESFIKRQIGVKPGDSWFPFDQLDYILGSMFLSSFYIKLEPIEYILSPFVWFSLHLIFSAIGYTLRFKKKLL